MELNIVAAVVAVGFCVVILALVANAPSLRAADMPMPEIAQHHRLRRAHLLRLLADR